MIEVHTGHQGLHEITDRVTTWLAGHSVDKGLLTLFVRHTSASLLIQENADPDVRRDLEDYFRRVAAEDGKSYRHSVEGPDDMPAHIRSALTSTQLAIPVIDARLALGTWQGIYLFEHRRSGFARTLALHVLGE
jgi:secondary thiamine-phosphate synthase enzyme